MRSSSGVPGGEPRAGREVGGCWGRRAPGVPGGPVIMPVCESRRFQRGPLRGCIWAGGPPILVQPSRGLISECSRRLSRSPCLRNSFWGARSKWKERVWSPGPGRPAPPAPFQPLRVLTLLWFFLGDPLSGPQVASERLQQSESGTRGRGRPAAGYRPRSPGVLLPGDFTILLLEEAFRATHRSAVRPARVKLLPPRPLGLSSG